MIRFGECFDLGEKLENWVNILFSLFVFFFEASRIFEGTYALMKIQTCGKTKEEGYNDERD